jgi:hypothetical protein
MNRWKQPFLKMAENRDGQKTLEGLSKTAVGLIEMNPAKV